MVLFFISNFRNPQSGVIEIETRSHGKASGSSAWDHRVCSFGFLKSSVTLRELNVYLYVILEGYGACLLS